MTIAEQIMAEAANRIYRFTYVVGACHDQRASHEVDQVNLVDTYTFEDGSKIAFRLGVVNQLKVSLDERDAKMAERYVAGDSSAEIGAVFGITASRVLQIVTKMGVPRSIGRPTKTKPIASGASP